MKQLADKTPWTGWQPVTPELCLSARCLAETLDGGQAFRWRWTDEEASGYWQGVFGQHVARLRLDPRGVVECSLPQEMAAISKQALQDYLNLNTDFAQIAHQLPYRSDPVLAAALKAFPGLRLLRQDLGETLLGFLCSSTKQIVQIRQMCDLLAERFGPEIHPGIHALPTWQELALVSEDSLRKCKLGYRARYISQCASFLQANPGYLSRITEASYPQAKALLCALPGVGEKIADCVLLFGGAQLEAFPVDTWIAKTLSRHYGLDGWSLPQCAHFGRVHFGAYAGYAQQLLFAWERQNKR